MMSYDAGFVMAILHNGSPVREINGKVHLPYHSEYKVRLKNKNGVRAKARAWIDGRQVSNLGDFILQPYETLDLERFLDQSLHSGNKFQFVPLSDSRVNDPTDHANGLVKVEFYKEKLSDWHFIIQDKPKVEPWKPHPYGGGKRMFGSNNMIPCSTTYDVTYTNEVMYVNNLCNVTHDSYDGAGATVEGGVSNQGFVYGTDFPTETFPVTLTLQIRGISNLTRENPEIIRTPKSIKDKKRFCSTCGKRRVKMSHKFCPVCGIAY